MTLIQISIILFAIAHLLIFGYCFLIMAVFGAMYNFAFIWFVFTLALAMLSVSSIGMLKAKLWGVKLAIAGDILIIITYILPMLIEGGVFSGGHKTYGDAVELGTPFIFVAGIFLVIYSLIYIYQAKNKLGQLPLT